MEQNLHSPEVYDFRQYDRIWQRVAPGLEPYPASEQGAVPAAAVARISAERVENAAQQTPSALAADAAGQAAARQESLLPGAQADPCCMGSAAAELLEVLTGFIEEELGDRRHLLALGRQAPVWARQRLRELAADAAGRARRLVAAHYLITGECYRPSVSCERISIGRWCPALRERYHAAACNGLNYARAAEGTTDPCLMRLLNELSADAYRSADVLAAMLERSLRG